MSATGFESHANVRSVFVYGTLRPGESNHPTVKWAEPKATPGKITGWALLGASHPYPMVKRDESAVTVGDVLTFNEAVWATALRRMDSLEGYPQMYDRTVVTVETDDGPVQAWVYEPAPEVADFAFDRMEPIPSGDWTAHLDALYGKAEAAT